ncbi:hypothetical protein DPMN_143205 [Dreissena polymorpha]|uniref:Uncharacterized protein n=1 Tax=Dreissena polymorpha TaxID=45954 RepID=A0A9D4JLH3_DREPO|nr:hypothetical protein DPMN_143205 [Dreissena polymorpha]
MQIIENGSGELIVSRRPGSNATYTADRCLPCQYCLGFFLNSLLWLYMMSCALMPDNEQPSTKFRRDASVLRSPFMKPVCEQESADGSLIQSIKETSANPGIPELYMLDK